MSITTTSTGHQPTNHPPTFHPSIHLSNQIVFICPDELHLNKIRKEHLRTTENYVELRTLVVVHSTFGQPTSSTEYPCRVPSTDHDDAHSRRVTLLCRRFCCQFNPVPNTTMCSQAPLRPSSHVYIVLQFLRNRCRHFDITYPLPWLFPNNKYLYIHFHVRQRVCPVCCCCCCCRCDSNPPGPTVFRAMGFIITIIHNTSSLLYYTIRTDRTNERTGALSRL